jgi:hypothetical protein|uniref:Uncharacterized protein n=1 Tax=Populus trichocarpa x Populus deltoides TaxID=3695 RepID=A9PJ68_9ROSI|nr:unknown [Populus trichocarpa x Populus deltoides]
MLPNNQSHYMLGSLSKQDEYEGMAATKQSSSKSIAFGTFSSKTTETQHLGETN